MNQTYKVVTTPTDPFTLVFSAINAVENIVEGVQTLYRLFNEKETIVSDEDSN